MSLFLSSVLSLCRKNIPLIAVLVFFSALYLIIAIGNHYYLRTAGWDYGLYNQMYWKYAHLKIDNTLFDPVLKIALQDHFSLTMIILVPLYWIIGLFAKTYTLLIVQALFVTLGAVGCYKLVFYKTKSSFLSLLAMIHFFTIQGILGAFTHDYHDIVLASCVIPFFLYFNEKGSIIKSLLCLLFIITSKENMPIIMFTIILVQFVYNRKDAVKRKQNIILAAVSVTYAVLLFLVFMPLLADVNRPSWVFKYYQLGNSFSQVIVYLLTHPLEALRLLFVNASPDATFNGSKLEFMIAMFFCWGAIFLIKKPLYFLCLIPLVAQKMYSDLPVMWGIYYYYSVEIACFLPAIVYICIGSFNNVRIARIVAYVAITANIAFTIHWLSGGTRVHWLSDRQKVMCFTPQFYENNSKIYFDKVCQLIPDTVSLCCTQRFTTYLSHRERISNFPNIRNYNYLVLDTMDVYPYTNETFSNVKTQILAQSNWQMIYHENSFYVYKRK